MIDTTNPVVRQELEWLATLPASQEAERLLQLVKAGRAHPSMPAILALLQWGIEDGAPEFEIDPTRAESMFQVAMMRLVEKGPKMATLWVLNLDNPEEEILPALADAETPEETAYAAISLAE